MTDKRTEALASRIRRPKGHRIWPKPLLLRIQIEAYHIIFHSQGVIG